MIGTEWLLTAAHCTDGISAGSMYAGVHRHERNYQCRMMCSDCLAVNGGDDPFANGFWKELSYPAPLVT